MRTLIPFAIFVFMATNLVAEQAPGTPTVITDPRQIQSKGNPDVQQWQLSIEKLFMVRRVGASAWAPDGKQIAFITDISGRNNLWVVPAEGGWPVQLTISEQRQASPAWSPDGKWIAYISDHDGDEQWDIFLVSPANGDVVNLTTTPDVSEESPAWSPDGRYLAYQGKSRTSSTYEISVMDVLTRKVRHLTSGTPAELSNVGPIWSHDGKWIAYTQQHAAGKDSNVLVVEVATGKSTLLTPHEGEHNYSAADWSPDGKKLLITSNANRYDNVGLLDVASKQIVWLTQDKWEVSAGYFSPDGHKVTWTTNVDGNVELVLHDLATGRSQPLPIAAGVNSLGGAESAFTRDGSRLLFYHDGPDGPRDMWAYDFARSRAQQLTNSFVGGVRSSDLVKPFLVHFPSKDGKWTISAYVYVPYNMQRDGRNAAVVYVHGGPAAQRLNNFDPAIQYLANAGYLVIAPNYRGSTGYGKEFMDANRFDMGGGDLSDVVAAAEWIKKSGYPDPKKIVVMGGSYGGYLTMMGVTKYRDEWAAGVAIVPFVNWFTEVKNEDPLLQQYDLATMGDPVKNKALWEERSPIFFVDRIKSPLLLLAGAHDPRCPEEESQQVADAVKKRGGVVELKIYGDEGHGFARVGNRIDAYQRVANFLKKYVPPADCGCSLY